MGSSIDSGGPVEEVAVRRHAASCQRADAGQSHGDLIGMHRLG